MKNVKME
jgi:hypothetical protein